MPKALGSEINKFLDSGLEGWQHRGNNLAPSKFIETDEYELDTLGMFTSEDIFFTFTEMFEDWKSHLIKD